MITLFKKNIHSFFFTLPPNTTKTGGGGDGDGDDYRLQFHQPISSGLVSAITRDPDRTPNVVESSKLMKPNSTPSASVSGFTHEIGGGELNGLTSCTESLGFESSDEREIQNTTNNNHHHHRGENGYYNKKTVSCDWRSRSGRRGECRNKVRSFPPPLSSLNRNGEPSFFLRPVRKDGRLELTEVRIHRPQILHAWRHDGRLTLHFVPDRSIEEEEEEIEEDEIVEQDKVQEEKEVAKKEQLVTIEEEEEEEGYGEYRFGNNEGLRCHQMVNHHHHHHHHLRMCGISTV